MKSIITFYTLISCSFLFGQTNQIGVSGGINWANIASTNFSGSYGSRTGVVTGLTYQTLFKNQILLGAEISYIQKGFKGYMSFTDASGNPENVKCSFNYNYLSLPIKGGYSFGKKIAGYVNMGIAPSFLLKANTIASAHYQSDGETFDVAELVKKVDLSGLLEIGTSYSFSKKLSANMAICFQRSFISITTQNYLFYSKIWHMGASLQFGIRYTI